MDEAALNRLFGSPAEFEGFNTPFQDAIDYHRQKVNVGTVTSRDLTGAEHDHKFVVAGVTAGALLEDINRAVADAIAKGETLETFSKKLDDAARKGGWLQGEGSEKVRAWRARIIYETNLRSAYQAGRLKQLRDPDVKKIYPYWRYVHAQTREPRVPRPMHLAWDGLVLVCDDPWFLTHFPPNGWFCTCGIEPVSRRELERMGKTGPDQAPEDGRQKIVDPDTGEVSYVPNGIDPGWDHAPGADWLAGVTPKLEAPAIKPVPKAEAQGFVAAVQDFLKSFLFGADHAAGDRASDALPEGAVITDRAGLPLPISADMFRAGRDWMASPDLERLLPAIAAAINDPDAIRLSFEGRRGVLTRHYITEAVSVSWSPAHWSWSASAPAGVTIYERAA